MGGVHVLLLGERHIVMFGSGVFSQPPGLLPRPTHSDIFIKGTYSITKKGYQRSAPPAMSEMRWNGGSVA